jgi:hypothetical protein
MLDIWSCSIGMLVVCLGSVATVLILFCLLHVVIVGKRPTSKVVHHFCLQLRYCTFCEALPEFSSDLSEGSWVENTAFRSRKFWRARERGSAHMTRFCVFHHIHTYYWVVVLI